MKMKTTSCFVSLVLLLSGIFVINVSGQNTDSVTADDYSRAVGMLRNNTARYVDRAGVRPIWLPDGRFWYQVSEKGKREFVLVDPATGKRTTAASRAKVREVIKSGPQPASRCRRSANVSSPDGKHEAFIRDYNLWVRTKSSKKETQLTTDGTKDLGYATDNAGWRKSDRAVILWSPDSKKIAPYQQDQRHEEAIVQDFHSFLLAIMFRSGPLTKP